MEADGENAARERPSDPSDTRRSPQPATDLPASCYTCSVIACPECGWFAEISRRAVEDIVWAEHVRDGF
jgi:hypothetical protein